MQPNHGYERVRQALLDRNQQVTIESLITWWSRRNASAITQFAVEILRGPVGRIFTIPPLPPFHPFPSEAIKTSYERMLFDEVRSRYGRVSAEAVYVMHVKLFELWCKESLRGLLLNHAEQPRFFHDAKTQLKEVR